jgi:hypothetical protein
MPNSDTVDRLEAMVGHPEIIKDGSPPFLPPKSRVSLDAGFLCPVCGSNMVTIRGKHSNSSERIVCPACLADHIDMIREIINRNK